MTRTETDLIELFATRADRAPDDQRLPDVLAPRRRRLAVPLAAAAVVGLAASAALLATRSSAPVDNQAGGGSALTDYGMQIVPAPAPLLVASRNVSSTESRVVYDSRGQSQAADVVEAVVYEPGQFDASAVQDGRPISFDGVQGFYGPALGHTDSGTGSDGAGTAPSIAWQYATDAWVVITGTSAPYQSYAAELPVARTIHPAAGVMIRVPFRVGTLPDGVVATRVDARIDDQSPSVSVGFGHELTISADVAGPIDNSVVIPDGAGFVQENGFNVTVTSDGTLSHAQLQDIADGLTLTNAGSTWQDWFPADTALGG